MNRETRLGGFLGIAAWVAFVIGFVVAPTPPVAGAATADITAYSADHTSALRLSAFLFALAGGLLIAFAAALRRWLGDLDVPGGWLADCVFAGGLATAVLDIAASAVFFTLATRGWQQGSGVAAALVDLVNYAFILLGFAVAVLAAAAGALLRRATTPGRRRLGAAGLAVAAIQVPYVLTVWFPAGPMVAGGAVSIVLFALSAVWLLALGIAMTREAAVTEVRAQAVAPRVPVAR